VCAGEDQERRGGDQKSGVEEEPGAKKSMEMKYGMLKLA